MTQAQRKIVCFEITPDRAREFFLYQDDEDVINGYAAMIDACPDDVQLRVDWGTDSRNHVIGGDVIIGPRFGGRSLDDDDLVTLALQMGAAEWVRPEYEPSWRIAV